MDHFNKDDSRYKIMIDILNSLDVLFPNKREIKTHEIIGLYSPFVDVDNWVVEQYNLIIDWLQSENYLYFKSAAKRYNGNKSYKDIIILEKGMKFLHERNKIDQEKSLPITLFNLSFSESITLITILYIFHNSFYNYGYFRNVGGNYISLFSFQDLIVANIENIGFFITAFFGYGFFYNVIVPLRVFTVGDDSIIKRYKIREKIIEFIKYVWLDREVSILIFSSMFFFGISLRFLGYDQSSVLVITFSSITFLIVFLFFTIGYIEKIVSIRQYVIWMLIVCSIYSYQLGAFNLHLESNNKKNMHIFIDNKNNCYERVLLKTSSIGILLYSPTLNRFEFRSKDDFVRIFSPPGCI